jgi:hypothetical protein
MTETHVSYRQSGWKKLNLISVIGVQFLNFLAYLFSIWPYSKPGKLVPIESSSIGHAINSTTKVITDLDVVKANLKIYITISVVVLCLGFIMAFILRTKSRGESILH